jgi:hypothetical protein
MTSPAEEQLREALDALAGGVHPAPDAYTQVRREWRRRERRRRLILYILVAVVFTCADLAGIWALNHANNQPHVIFNQPTSTHVQSPQTVLP